MLRCATLPRHAAQNKYAKKSIVVMQDSSFRYLTSHLCKQTRNFSSALFTYPTVYTITLSVIDKKSLRNIVQHFMRLSTRDT